jgi:prophage DNA circulation protein
MVYARDWISTLWPASYMGVPFYFEHDDSEGGRDAEVHEYFGAESWDVEDTGIKARKFSGLAYVASDVADQQAVALEQVFESKGPGTLVVPIMGPVSVHCEDFKRTSDKDKLGFITFHLKFVSAGPVTPAAPFVSVPQLGQTVFEQAAALWQTGAGMFPDALVLNNPADYIVAGAVDEVANVVAAIETVRTVNPVDADTSAAVAAADVAIVTAAPLLIAYGNPAAAPLKTTPASSLINSPNPEVAAVASAIVTLLDKAPAISPSLTDPTAILAATIGANISQLADGLQGNPDAGAGAMLSLYQALAAVIPTPLAVGASPNAVAAAANAAAILAFARIAALAAWGEALERQTYQSRADAVAARALFAEIVGDELGSWTGAAGFPVYVALQDLQGAVVQYLTQLMANLAPVVTISSPQSMPALWWAWRLYQDPTRAVDLVLRNNVVHPSFMPLSFEALAPGYAAPPNMPVNWPSP